jgi:prepilin-type N-terminal cleavage/methylation domain-containing protein
MKCDNKIRQFYFKYATQGMTLIEVLICFAILAIVMVGALSLIFRTNLLSNRMMQAQSAETYALDLYATIKSYHDQGQDGALFAMTETDFSGLSFSNNACNDRVLSTGCSELDYIAFEKALWADKLKNASNALPSVSAEVTQTSGSDGTINYRVSIYWSSHDQETSGEMEEVTGNYALDFQL